MTLSYRMFRALIGKTTRQTIICLSLPAAVSAQSWEIFNMANAGLPSNTITALVQDGNGIVWAATDWGLCRYDGDDWQVYQQQDGLPDNGLSCLAVDTLDRLWIGTNLHGIAILDGDEWTLIDMDNGPLPDNTIHGITHDHRGWVWISTALGLACITDTGWRIYDNTPESHMGFEFFSPNVRKVTVREDGLVSIATMNGGLTYVTEEAFTYFTSFNSNFPDNSANAIALDSNGDRWLASAAAGLIRHAGPYESGPWFNYNAQNSGFPDNTLTSLVIDEADTKYAGTELGGIIVYQANGEWSTLNEANSGLPDDRVISLMRDAEGRLWAGTFNGGIARANSISAIESIATLDTPLVYPVPFVDRVHVSWPVGDGNHHWQVVDVAGRQVAKGQLQRSALNTLDLGHMEAGTFYIIFQRGNDRFFTKLVKIDR